MAKRTMISENSERPWGLTIAGVFGAVVLLSMPSWMVFPDQESIPEILKFLGRFHPLILHLPIGVFVLILLQELGLLLSKRRRELPAGIGFSMFFGVLSAILAVLAGFLLLRTSVDDYAGNELAERHLWGGVVFAVLTLATMLVKAWTIAQSGNPAWYRAVLFLTVGIMSFASHDGASMTHGSDYLTQYAPEPIRRLMGAKSMDSKTVTESPVLYADVVQPIFERRCVQCHKEGKSKGKLRLDTFDMLVLGGKEGPAIEPGNSAGSNIVVRMTLPEDDDERMPPEGKPPVEDHELLVIKWWIDQGASATQTLQEAEVPSEIAQIVSELLKSPIASADEPSTKGHQVVPHLLDANLQSQVQMLAKKYPGVVAFESQDSPGVTFTAVSMRGKFKDDDFSEFAALLPHLVQVDLTASLVTDRSIQLLEKAKSLRQLRLGQTAITDDTLDILVKIPSLESLNLYGTKVTDAGVLKLAALPSLKRLYLWQTEVTPAAVKQLEERLPNCEIVMGALSQN